MPQVQLKNGPSFDAAPGEDLLSAGLKAGIYLEHSCRIGRCSSCKGRIVSGEVECFNAQTGLTPDELRDGYILTCCHRAKTDVVLDAEYLDLPPIKAVSRPCKIDSMDFVGDVARLTLRLPPGEGFVYYPGQYLQLAKGHDSLRSYSIANAMRNDGRLELHIKRQPGGLFSEYVFSTARIGDLLKLVGPSGSFFYKSAKSGALVFLATGTGIAPVKAIIEQLIKQTGGPRVCTLYWGNRMASDFYWQPAMREGLEIRYVPVASREGPGWQGMRGHVQDVLLRDQPDCSGLVVYACGSAAMIRDAKAALLARGLPQDKFFSDAFVASN